MFALVLFSIALALAAFAAFAAFVALFVYFKRDFIIRLMIARSPEYLEWMCEPFAFDVELVIRLLAPRDDRNNWVRDNQPLLRRLANQFSLRSLVVLFFRRSWKHRTSNWWLLYKGLPQEVKCDFEIAFSRANER